MNEKDEERRQDLITSIRRDNTSAPLFWNAVNNINLHREYDFSDAKLQDSVGLEVPKIRELEVG